MRILPRIISFSQSNPASDISQKLIREEAAIGGQLFGVVPKGHDRQFFCLDEHTWVWHEAWSDQAGSHSVTTRYEIRPNGVFKVQDGGTYESLSPSEAKNLLRAAELYADKIVPGYQAAVNAA